jgi:hypothetical protein
MIYLASPYSHPDPTIKEARFEAACRVAANLMRRGELVFSPIAHSHPIAVCGGIPGSWECWQAFDEIMINACSELRVLMLPGWSDSVGVAAEVAIAERLGKPVKYMADTKSK